MGPDPSMCVLSVSPENGPRPQQELGPLQCTLAILGYLHDSMLNNNREAIRFTSYCLQAGGSKTSLSGVRLAWFQDLSQWSEASLVPRPLSGVRLAWFRDLSQWSEASLVPRPLSVE